MSPFPPPLRSRESLRIDDVPEPRALTILPHRETPAWFGVPDCARYAEAARRAELWEPGDLTSSTPVTSDEMEATLEADLEATLDRLYAIWLGRCG